MKKGLIVYNGALKTEKTLKLINELKSVSEEMNMDLTCVKNNEFIQKFDENGNFIVSHNNMSLKEIDYAIFWDKDVFLAENLENMGIRLFNRSEAIANCDNKALTFEKLKNQMIRMPKTIVSPFVFNNQGLSDEYIDSVIKYIGLPMIIKECYGSFGMQVYMASSRDEMNNIISDMDNRPFIFQEYIENSRGRDVRVVIVGDEIVGAMLRKNPDDFRANITIGGSGTFYELTDEQKSLALKAHRALGLDFSGIDLLFGDDGKPILCEVNSNLNFLSFEKVSGISVAKKILSYINSSLE